LRNRDACIQQRNAQPQHQADAHDDAGANLRVLMQEVKRDAEQQAVK